MPTATLTSKGQITLPAEVRKDLGLKTGDRIYLLRNEKTGEYTLKPKTGSVRDLFGILKYDGPPIGIEEMNQGIADHLAEDNERIQRQWRERS